MTDRAPPTDAPEAFEVEPDEDAEGAEELRLDPEVAARRAAALARIRRFGDPVLRTRARVVEHLDDALRDEIGQMSALMGDAFGVGLAAPQVGILHRLLVYRVQHQAPVAVLINPEVDWTGKDKEEMEEGCLSLPGVHVDVERPIHVRVRALDPEGE